MFDEVNRWSTGQGWEFWIASFEDSRLVVYGSFDRCYYHQVELTFDDVELINCPTAFYAPQFRDAGPGGEEGRRYAFTCDESSFEIIAWSASVRLGMVYYYYRGAELRPGERIADWANQSKGKGTS